MLDHVIDYIDRRTSKTIHIVKVFPDNDIIIRLNASLFEWVIENLCKNAVDAMGGVSGTITLHVETIGERVIVEVSDTGKGIKKKDLRNVFKPGFTTKSRGWGLGLSLAKRIVEEYHNGKIFVKAPKLGKRNYIQNRTESKQIIVWHNKYIYSFLLNKLPINYFYFIKIIILHKY